MSPPSGLLKDSAIYGASDLVGRAIAFAAFPIVAAAVSPAVFGMLDLLLTLTTLLTLVASCGLNNAVQRYYFEEQGLGETGRLVSTALWMQLSLSLLTVFLGFALAPVFLRVVAGDAPEFTFLAYLAALLAVPVSLLVQFFQDLTRLHFAPFRFAAIVVVGRVLTAVLAIVAVVVMGLSVEGFLFAQVLGLTAAAVMGALMTRRDISREYDKPLARRLIVFGYPFIFASVAYWIFGAVDRWMLVALVDLEEAGVYSVAFRFAGVITFAIVAFGAAFSPHAMRYRQQHPDTYRDYLSKVLAWLLFALLVLGGGLSLFAGEILGLIMPADYRGSSTPMIFLCFGIVLQGTTQVSATGLSLEGKTGLMATAAWIVAGANFAFNLALIPLFGASGAAVATLISYGLLSGLYLFWGQRHHPLPFDWPLLGLLVSLGAVVLTVAIWQTRSELDPTAIAIKLAVAALCVLVALPLLLWRARQG